MMISKSLAAAAIALITMAGARAQIPPGHVVVTSNNLGSGTVGIHVAHPRSNGPMTTIQGTDPSVWSAGSSGPQCVAIHAPTGDLLVGEVGTGSIALHRLRLQGLTVAQHTSIAIGTANNDGVYGIAQQDEHHVLVACHSVTNAALPPLPNDILQVDLRTGSLVRVHGWAFFAAVQALAYEPATGTIFWSQVFAGTSAIGMIQGSTVTMLASTNQGDIRSIAIDSNGDLLCSGYGASYGVIRITRQGVVSYPYPIQGYLVGIARETATGQLFLLSGALRTLQRLDPVTGIAVAMNATVSGYMTSLALAPDPIIFGAPSGDGSFNWSSSGHRQGLPLAGSPWTVQVDWPLMPATWSALSLGGAPASAPLRVLNLDVLLDAGAMWGWMPMTSEPAFSRSTRTLFLPASAAGMSVFLQSAHVTNTGTFGASSGLQCHIL